MPASLLAPVIERMDQEGIASLRIDLHRGEEASRSLEEDLPPDQPGLGGCFVAVPRS